MILKVTELPIGLATSSIAALMHYVPYLLFEQNIWMVFTAN